MKALGLIAILSAGPAAALELSLPSNARVTAERATRADSYAAPVGVFGDGSVPTVSVEGQIDRAAWQITSPGLTTLQVLDPLRTQVRAAGFDIVLDCDEQTCGGFDFRFAVEVLPAPNMYVNLRAYRFLTALRGPADAPEAAVTLMVSTTPTAAFVQIVRAGAVEAVPVTTSPAASLQAAPVAEGPFADTLLADGHAVLTGVDFATGSTALGAGPFAALDALAAFLQARPGIQIALVGHTDSVGDLDTNIRLSRARAASVRERLVTAFGIDPARLRAEGMGYLAPVASNLDPAGREANRRVEVVLLSEN
ncbi:MAG: OmpA family protein [Pseudomonadota bacterium]